MRKAALIDTQLLVLLVVGLTDPEFISKHRRLHPVYTKEQFRRLEGLLRGAPTVICSSHILTEASNLLGLCGEPMRSRIFSQLKALIGGIDERHIPARLAATSTHFNRLGLTDVALTHLPREEILLLTVDHDLSTLMSGAGFEVENMNSFLFE